MMQKETALLRVGVLGCGPIAQAAHFDACRKARNAELYAICDRAADLRETIAAIHRPTAVYADYAAMLADPQVQAIIIAVADQFHVPLAQQALAAGKPVLIEKPLGVSVEECAALEQQAAASGLTVQVGNNKRFDPGIAFAQRFIREEVGEVIGLKAWYCDSAARYSMTDNLQPIITQSAAALRPTGNPKADRRRYLMLTHGSHLLDTARYLCGEIERVAAQLVERAGQYAWFITAQFASGAVGQLQLVVALQGDWEEGFEVFGTGGSVKAKTYLPWFHKSSEVECFAARDSVYRRPLGADAHTYKLQVEGWADTILHAAPQVGGTVSDGLAALRGMVAVARAVEQGGWVNLAAVTGGV